MAVLITSTMAVLRIIVSFNVRYYMFSVGIYTYRNGSTVLSGSLPQFQQARVIDLASLTASQAWKQCIEKIWVNAKLETLSNP
jgi:hypothetical protein